jgi:hypothetical protein
MAQRDRGDERTVGDLHAVEHLEAARAGRAGSTSASSQTARRPMTRLESALERRILDVLAVLVQRRAPIYAAPLASIGKAYLPASIDPSAAPAPTTVCNSSTNSRCVLWRL